MPLLYDVASILDYAKGYILCVSESFSVKERFNAAIGLMHEAMKAMFEEGELCPGLDRFSLHLSDLLNNYEQMGAIYMDNLPRGGFDTPVKELIRRRRGRTDNRVERLVFRSQGRPRRADGQK